MTNVRSSAAYDLSMFDTRSTPVVALEPNKKAKYAKKKRSRAQSVLNGIVTAALVSICLAAVLFFIVGRVKLTEMNSVINDLDEQLSILQSENVRLNGELCGIASADKIEEYAKKNGLKKVEANQIEYFTIEDGDRIEKTSKTEGFLSSIGILSGEEG